MLEKCLIFQYETQVPLTDSNRTDSVSVIELSGRQVLSKINYFLVSNY